MGEINIVRKNGGLGRRNPSEDAISGMVISVQNYVPSLIGKVIELNGISDAITLGITKLNDQSFQTKVHYEIAEFYRIAPGVKLFILIVDNFSFLGQLADKTSQNLPKLLRSNEAKGRIRQAAICLDDSFNTTFDDVLLKTVNGSDTYYSGAVVNAQELALEEERLKRPVLILIEGKGFNGSGTSAIDLRAAKCNMVAVTIAKNNFGNYYQNTRSATIGTVLGMIAKRKVNECIGFVGEEGSPINGNIQDNENYTIPKLSSNISLDGYSETDWTQLDAKAYIYPKTYIGRDGVFLNDSHTCTELSDDYCTIENVRVIHKAERIAYKSLVPYINSTIDINEDGTLPESVCSFFQNAVNVDLRQQMQNVGEISFVDSFVNPQQNLLATSEIEVAIEIVPTGVARKIRIPIGFKNPFKQ